MSGCSNAKKATASADETTLQTVVTTATVNQASKNSVMPKAIIYKTNGNYINNVPITLSADRKSVVSYPAPSDLSASQLPIQLKNGYLLDRRGVSTNTAFTRYTYTEYAKLAEAPTTAQLLKSVIPDALITEIVKLPINISKAVADTAACNDYITSGFKNCQIVQSIASSVQFEPQ